MGTYNIIAGKLRNAVGDPDPSFDHIVAGTDVIYDSEYPLIVNGCVECDTTPISDPTGNPHEQGWCEEEVDEGEGTGKYILTEDTSVEEGKDYYKPIGARQDAINNQLRTSVSDLTGIALHASEYNEATIHEGDNPQANGWYELSGTTYVLTSDTTVVSGKTYYIRVAKITSNEDKIISKEDGYIPTAGAVGRALGANFEDNLQSTSTVKGLTANMGRVLNENKADINGYYETMSVGSAKNLDGETINSEAYLIRPTGGAGNEVVSGLASVVGMEGNSCVWNQLIRNNLLIVSGDTSHLQAQRLSNGTIQVTVTGTLTQTTFVQFSSDITKFYLSGHKYLLILSQDIDTSVLGYNKIWWQDTSDTYIAARRVLKTYSQNTNGSFYIFLATTVTPGTYNFTPQAIDLTLLGIDNFTTRLQVETWLAQHVGTKPYYGYNPGTILSANTLGFKTYSRNLLNPEDGLAKLIPYTHTTNSNKYTVKGIPTGAAVTYTPDNTGVAVDVTSAITDNTFDISSYGSGTLYIPNATTNTYVCMKYDGAMDDEIVPYKENTYNFDVTKVYGKTSGSDTYVQCYPNGMNSCGSVHDTLTASEAVNKVGKVNLGDYTYTRLADTLYQASIPNLGRTFNTSTIINAVTSLTKYIIGTQQNWPNVNYQISGNSNVAGGILLKDKDYPSNPAGVKQAVNGVIFVYEYSNYITYTDLIYRDGGIDRPLREVLVNLNVDNWSMEEQLMADYDEQGNPTSVPATIQTKYSIDAVEAIKTLEDNVADLQEATYTETEVRATFGNLLDEINTHCSSILGGTFSIVNPTGKTLTFTFTGNASTNSTEENPETI